MKSTLCAFDSAADPSVHPSLGFTLRTRTSVPYSASHGTFRELWTIKATNWRTSKALRLMCPQNQQEGVSSARMPVGSGFQAAWPNPTCSARSCLQRRFENVAPGRQHVGVEENKTLKTARGKERTARSHGDKQQACLAQLNLTSNRRISNQKKVLVPHIPVH